MIRAVIFDMDGLLIDSEPFWHESEIAVFSSVGIRLTKEDCLKTVGVRVDEIVDFHHKRSPWESPSKKAVTESIIGGVIDKVRNHGEPKEGVDCAMKFVKSMKVKIALASSSTYSLIGAVLDRLNIKDDFELIYSAEEEKYGKPHPGVYITAAEKLGVMPEECLVFEDSVNGVIAAKAAKMRCIAVPETAARDDKRFAIADAVVGSLAEIDAVLWNRLNESS